MYRWWSEHIEHTARRKEEEEKREEGKSERGWGREELRIVGERRGKKKGLYTQLWLAV